MAHETAVLGIGTSSSDDVLTIYRVIVRRTGDAIEVETLEPWQGSAADEARSMNDLVEALGNTLDPKRKGAPEALAVKRVESTFNRPSRAYDQKVRAEGIAMVAATGQGRRYFAYRTNQLTHGADLKADAARHQGYPSGAEAQGAVAAACEALFELRKGAEDEV
jgi:hypothetical protein